MPPPKKPAASQVNVFIGSDEARVKEAALMLVRSLTPPDAGDFSNDIIDGTAFRGTVTGDHVRGTCDGGVAWGGVRGH